MQNVRFDNALVAPLERRLPKSAYVGTLHDGALRAHMMVSTIAPTARLLHCILSSPEEGAAWSPIEAPLREIADRLGFDRLVFQLGQDPHAVVERLS